MQRTITTLWNLLSAQHNSRSAIYVKGTVAIIMLYLVSLHSVCLYHMVTAGRLSKIYRSSVPVANGYHNFDEGNFSSRIYKNISILSINKFRRTMLTR